MLGVDDAGEQTAKLHGGRELAATIEGGAGRHSLGLIDDDHADRMRTWAAEWKPFGPGAAAKYSITEDTQTLVCRRGRPPCVVANRPAQRKGRGPWPW
jgi:hypothetical protein